MPDFPPVLNLSSLDGTNGFGIRGEHPEDRPGYSISSAGDINNDGFDDVIVGSPSGGSSQSRPGLAHVVFGRAGGFPATVELAHLDGTYGFQITGERSNTGHSVSSAGDVNGDGIDDLIVSATTGIRNGPGPGTSYVIFGKVGGFGANLNLSSLDGSNGFQINDATNSDRAGWAVASAGDVNGDGIDDLIIGAPLADRNGEHSGASFVVFGKAGGFAAELDLSSLDGSNGFQISGESASDYSGRSVSSAGDVNGDGFDDVIVGAPSNDPGYNRSGATYVVFGKAGGFSANLDLSSLNGSNGFKIRGEGAGDYSGRSVSSAGDVNGDGIDDLIIGAPVADPNGVVGASYVIFGKTEAFSANLSLSSLDGSDGFRISGEAVGDYSGRSVSSAGDVNGDGFDDLLIGAPFVDASEYQAGACYVVFGKAGGFAANLDLSSLDGANGFQIDGEAYGAFTGYSVYSADDVNGDGFDDLIISALGGGLLGDSYVVFGRAPTEAVTRLGTNIANTISGGSFGDTLNGLGGADTLRGLGGNDTYVVDTAGDEVLEAAGGGTADRVYASASYVLAAGVQVEILGTTSIAGTAAIDLTGNAFVETLYGNAGVNVIKGGAGANTLNGAGGADTLQGFAGNDTYIVDNAGDRVLEAAGGGAADRVNALASYVLAANQQVEILGTARAAGTGAINLTGNAFAQTLYGNAGSNILNGQGGADILQGFGGNDTYVVDAAGDQVLEAAGGGTADRVNASVSYTLGANQQVEILGTTGIAGTGAIDLTGNAFVKTLFGNAGVNVIKGGAGANTLNGAGGADTLQGFGGNDTYVVDTAGDRVLEAAGGGTADRVNASVSYTLAAGQEIETLSTTSVAGTGAINLTGNAFNQAIHGNIGANVLDGAGGSDTLTGYSGSDTFSFTTALGAGNVDHITDFSVAADTIRLAKTVFSALGTGPLAASAFKDVGDPGAVVDASDRILYDDDTGELFYDTNGSGAGGRTRFAVLDTSPDAVTFADFVVVA